MKILNEVHVLLPHKPHKSQYFLNQIISDQPFTGDWDDFKTKLVMRKPCQN